MRSMGDARGSGHTERCLLVNFCHFQLYSSEGPLWRQVSNRQSLGMGCTKSILQFFGYTVLSALGGQTLYHTQKTTKHGIETIWPISNSFHHGSTDNGPSWSPHPVSILCRRFTRDTCHPSAVHRDNFPPSFLNLGQV